MYEIILYFTVALSILMGAICIIDFFLSSRDKSVDKKVWKILQLRSHRIKKKEKDYV